MSKVKGQWCSASTFDLCLLTFDLRSEATLARPAGLEPANYGFEACERGSQQPVDCITCGSCHAAPPRGHAPNAFLIASVNLGSTAIWYAHRKKLRSVCWRSLKNAQISTEVDRPLSLSVTRRLSMSWCVPCWNRTVFGEPTEELPPGVFIEEHVEEFGRALDDVDDHLFHFLIIEA